MATQRRSVASWSRAVGAAMLLAMTLSCSDNPPISNLPGVLSITSKGGPNLIVKVGTSEVARLPCDAGAVLAPGTNGVPGLPWTLQLVQQDSGRTIHTQTIAELPQWVVINGGNVLASASPIAGPKGPPCP